MSTKKKETKPVNDVEISTEADGIPQLSDEQIEFARLTMREEFNKKFSKWAEIAEEKADDDFIEQCKKELDEGTKEITCKRYLIAPADDGAGIRTAKFLREWNDEFNKWKRGEWRGVILFDRVISGLIAEMEADPEKPFTIDYSTLMFLYATMKEPAGTGLAQARLMAKYENYDEEKDAPGDDVTVVTYSGVLERVYNHIRELSAYDKKFAILKQRLDLAYATAKMELKISALEEFIEFHEAITAASLPDDDKELGKVMTDAAKS